ncbi:carotenoid 1,2-hydratase, partial [bacterium]
MGIVVGLCVLLPRGKTTETTVDLVGLPVTPAQGFRRVTAPLPLHFPLDQGAHPEYQTEWWYYTGNLVDGAGNRFGYQLTFFRRGIVPPSDAAMGSSTWRTTQVYFAHFALTDVTREQFAYRERFSRGAAGLAGAQGDPTFSVW